MPITIGIGTARIARPAQPEAPISRMRAAVA